VKHKYGQALLREFQSKKLGRKKRRKERKKARIKRKKTKTKNGSQQIQLKQTTSSRMQSAHYDVTGPAGHFLLL